MMDRRNGPRFATASTLLLMAVTEPAAAGTAAAIRAQTGDHADHSRLVLVLPPGAKPEAETGSCGGRITLAEKANWPVAQLNATYSRRFTDFQATRDSRELTVRWPCGARVTVIRERDLLIVDAAEPPVPKRKPRSMDATLSAEAEPTPPPTPQAMEVLAAALNPVTSAQAQPLPTPSSNAPLSLLPATPAAPKEAPSKPQPQPAPQPAIAPAPPSPTLEQSVRDSVEQTLRQLEASPVPKAPAAPPPVPAHATEPPPPPIGPFDVAAWAGESFRETRERLQQAANTAQGRGRVDAFVALARFALARAMPEEGRAALDTAETLSPAPDQRYQLRVLRDAFRALDGTADPEESLFVKIPPGASPDHHVWRSATLAPTRWADVREMLPIVLKRLLAYPADLRNHLLTQLAEAAAVDAADTGLLNVIVLEMITLDGPTAADGRLDYFRGRLAEFQKHPDTALGHYGQAAATPGPFGHRAAVRAIELRRATDALDDAGVIKELEALRFAWRGDQIETAALSALGEAYTRVGRTDAALDIFGLVGRRFGATSHGRAALGAGRSLLTAVLDHLADSGPGTLNTLSLHMRHGRLVARVDTEGAPLQRRLARLLARDGFSVEASRILHALTEEARGAERAELGGELAGMLIGTGRTEEALDVLSRTGEPGLDAGLIERRALLRAAALTAEGDAMRAIDTVRGLPGTNAARVRAQSLFQAGEWPAARAAFAEIVETPDGIATADDVAYYGIAAYRSGDIGGVRAAADRHRDRLAGTRWAGLLDVLATPDAMAAEPTADEVSRQLAAADSLAAVARRWRAAP